MSREGHARGARRLKPASREAEDEAELEGGIVMTRSIRMVAVLVLLGAALASFGCGPERRCQKACDDYCDEANAAVADSCTPQDLADCKAACDYAL
jgi:hypothetical protein